MATRLQIASIELSVAKNNAGKDSNLCCSCRPFRPLCARFYIGRTSCYFLGRSPHFVSCCIAGVYLLLFLFFLGKARNLAANMPYAFEESRQILAADVAAFRASCNKKAGVAAQQPVDPTEGENNNAGK